MQMGSGRGMGAKEAKERGKEAYGSRQGGSGQLMGMKRCKSAARAMHVRCKGTA